MLWGALGLFLAVYGFFSSNEAFLIPVGIVFVLIGIRRTVFNYEKMGTFANFSVLVIAVTLGALVYFFDDDGISKQEVTKIDNPRTVPIERSIAKTPTPKPTIESAQISPRRQAGDFETYALSMKCAKQEDLDNIVVGKNVRGIDLLLCPDFEKITIPYRSGYEMGTNTLNLDENFTLNRDSTKFIHMDFLSDTMVLSPTKNKLNNSYVFFQILDRDIFNQQINEKKEMYTLRDHSATPQELMSDLENLAFNMKCSEQADFEKMVLGENGLKDVYVKLCRGDSPINVTTTFNHRTSMSHDAFEKDYFQTPGNVRDVISSNYLSNAIVLALPDIETHFPNVEYVLVHIGTY